MLKTVRSRLWMAMIPPLLVAIGCSSSDERLIELGQQSCDRQAQQNQTIAEQSQRVTETTQQFVEANGEARREIIELQRELGEANADARQELIQIQQDLVDRDAQCRQELNVLQRETQSTIQTERQSLDQQREDLETERQKIAGQRQRAPIIAAAIAQVGLLAACLLPLVLCFYMLRTLRNTAADDEAVAQLLIEEIVADRPRFLPGPGSVPAKGRKVQAAQALSPTNLKVNHNIKDWRQSMSTVLDEPASRSATTPAQHLRTTMAAVRVSLQWFGVRKSLTVEQKNQAADTFGAEGAYLSAGKKLLETKHPSFKAVTAVKNKAVGFWKSMTLPFPESGVRLIRQDKVEQFDTQMREYQAELTEAVATLDRHYAELKSAARDRLGTLFNEADYPASLEGMFQLGWDFPSVEPPDYLQQLNPELYQQECQRVQQRFDEAVRLAEEAFIAELAKLVSHLTERLSGQADGKSKIFRDSAIGNLSEFFERFKSLNVRSSEQLDGLVADAQRIVSGVEPQSLRDNGALRQHVATELSRVQSVLDGLLIDRPRRNILRRPK